jgi:predicted dehydrogenase
MPANNPKIRWGVLGWARIAHKEVIPAIQRSSNGVLHAMASRDAAKLVECQTQFNPPHLHPSYDDLVRDPEVDAVYNPLPNSLHKEWTIKAAEQGKHVLCEKPVALNAAECREMIAACRANGVVFMEAFMYRYTARTIKVRELLRSGKLGEIKFVQSQFRFLLNRPGDVRRNAGLGGGSLYDVGSYPVNFIGMVMDEITHSAPGQGPRAESVSVQCVQENGVDELFSALVRYPGGVVAALHSGFNAHFRIFTEIIGTQGALEIPLTFLGNSGPLTLTIGENKQVINVGESDRYRLQVENFADAIVHGRQPLLTVEETLRNMELLDRLYAEIA